MHSFHMEVISNSFHGNYNQQEPNNAEAVYEAVFVSLHELLVFIFSSYFGELCEVFSLLRSPYRRGTELCLKHSHLSNVMLT